MLVKEKTNNKSGDFRVTHQAPANRWSLFSSIVSFIARFLFFGRTDTMCENNDHLFGRGLVGQSEEKDRECL